MNVQKPEEILQRWAQRIEAEPEPYRPFKGRYLWSVSGPAGGSWILSPAEIPAVRPIPIEEVSRRHGRDQCRLELSGATLDRISSGKLNPQTALIRGELKITGSTEDIFELNFILERLIPDSSSGV